MWKSLKNLFLSAYIILSIAVFVALGYYVRSLHDEVNHISNTTEKLNTLTEKYQERQASLNLKTIASIQTHVEGLTAFISSPTNLALADTLEKYERRLAQLEEGQGAKSAELTEGYRALLQLWLRSRIPSDPTNARKGTIGDIRGETLRNWLRERRDERPMDVWLYTASHGELKQAIQTLGIRIEDVDKREEFERSEQALNYRARIRFWLDSTTPVDPYDATKGTLGDANRTALRDWLREGNVEEPVAFWLNTALPEHLKEAIDRFQIE